MKIFISFFRAHSIFKVRLLRSSHVDEGGVRTDGRRLHVRVGYGRLTVGGRLQLSALVYLPSALHWRTARSGNWWEDRTRRQRQRHIQTTLIFLYPAFGFNGLLIGIPAVWSLAERCGVCKHGGQLCADQLHDPQSGDAVAWRGSPNSSANDSANRDGHDLLASDIVPR